MATILIIEDDPSCYRDLDEMTSSEDEQEQRDVMGAMFKKAGHEVLLACDEARALSILKLRASSIALMTCDGSIRGKGMGTKTWGKDLVRAVRQQSHQFPIIYVSDTDPGEETLEEIGANAFFRKPVSEGLVAMADALIHKLDITAVPKHAYLVSQAGPRRGDDLGCSPFF